MLRLSPEISAKESFTTKVMNWMKKNPAITIGTIAAILAIASFLTAGFMVPIVLGVVGIIAGSVASFILVASLAALCDNRYIKNDRAESDRAGNYLSAGLVGLVFGALVSAFCPPIGLVALSLLIGGTVFGLAAACVKYITKRNQSDHLNHSDTAVRGSSVSISDTLLDTKNNITASPKPPIGEKLTEVSRANLSSSVPLVLPSTQAIDISSTRTSMRKSG